MARTPKAQPALILRSPLEPPELAPMTVAAFKALAAGKATEGQQKHVLSFIVNDICDTYGETFRIGPDGLRLSDFAQGKRHAGNTIVTICNRPPPPVDPRGPPPPMPDDPK